jgi:ABC-type glycerol-3-phosphate transport system permease component
MKSLQAPPLMEREKAKAHNRIPPPNKLLEIHWRRTISQLPLHSGLILWGLFAIFPLVWILLTSLKSTPELYQDPFGIPQAWKWTNYRDAWVYAKMGSYFLNSVFTTFLSTILVLFLSSTFAFALARFDFPLKGQSGHMSCLDF